MKQSKSVPIESNTSIKNSHEIPVQVRLDNQESKMSELVSVVNSFCTATKTMTEQFSENLKMMREEHKQEYKLLKENKEEREKWKKTMIRVNESYTQNLTNISVMADNLKELYDDWKRCEEESIPDEPERRAAKVSNTDLRDEITSLIKGQLDVLKIDESRRNTGSPLNSLSDTVKETLKFEIINKNGGMKRDYKLEKNGKYEHFYDYFSSELRSFGLLHIIEDTVESNADEKMLDEQRFKVRDILINHIDRNYYSKVMKIQNPKEILIKLKELKRCEINVTSHSVRKQLYSMQYIIGKIMAVEFCEKFEETIRNYENSPGATPLSEDEKRDAFYNAIMVSVPTVQSIEFLFKNTKGISPDYEQLKNLVMQDEATRKQMSGETSEVKSANLAQRVVPRCFKCQASGHLARDCRNEGILCYNCQKFGSHIVQECPELRRSTGGPSKPRDYSKGNDNNSYNKQSNSSQGFGGGRFRRGLKRRANGAYERSAKRGRFKSNRGNYKYSSQNHKTDKNNNKSNSSKQGNQKNGEKSDEGSSTTKGKTSLESMEIKTMYMDVTQTDEHRFFTEFLADSGAIEHLTKSKIIFKTFDESDCGVIKCANKDESADLRTEGVGRVEIQLENGRILEIDKVIFAEALKENLLSLRKFAEMGLAIYLDNEKINIFDPTSKELFVLGIYKRPYWVVELEVNKSNLTNNNLSRTVSKRVIAHLAEGELEGRKYFTRSMAAKENSVKPPMDEKKDEQTEDVKEMIVDEEGKERSNEKPNCDENKSERSPV